MEVMIMPMHKRESLIYTVLMCFTMVLWMSMYNVALHMGTLNMQRDLHFVFW